MWFYSLLANWKLSKSTSKKHINNNQTYWNANLFVQTTRGSRDWRRQDSQWSAQTAGPRRRLWRRWWTPPGSWPRGRWWARGRWHAPYWHHEWAEHAAWTDWKRCLRDWFDLENSSTHSGWEQSEWIWQLPAWNFLVCVFDRDRVWALDRRRVGHCVRAVTVLCDFNWFGYTWKQQQPGYMIDLPKAK